MRIVSRLTEGWMTQNPAGGRHTHKHDEKLSHESSFNTYLVRESQSADALRGLDHIYTRVNSTLG
jgi:hypothetical protein